MLYPPNRPPLIGALGEEMNGDGFSVCAVEIFT